MHSLSPTFAIVGRVNKGKSSIVAALTERDDVAIGPDPGTTTDCHIYPVYAEKTAPALFTLIDTPGFQRPEAAYAWMAARVTSDAEAPTTVRAFVETHAKGDDFVDECRLLTPVLEGASILYVVDVSQPFGRSYEFEAKILRWAGRPRIALLNKTGEDDFTDEWRKQLSPYFNAVRSFNAHQSLFRDRLSLLNILAELDDSTRAALQSAMQQLTSRQLQRRHQAAGIMAMALKDLLRYQLKQSRPSASTDYRQDLPPDAAQGQLMSAKFADGLRHIETGARRQIETLYAHHRLQKQEEQLTAPIFEQDIFAASTWQLLGLSRQQLVISGALGGAAVGGSIDAAVAGHSFLLGTVLGGLIGAGGGLWATQKSPELSLAGMRVSGAAWIVGPVRNPNFAWILLDRALLHARSVLFRSHARRDHLIVAGSEEVGIVGQFSSERRRRLAKIFARLNNGLWKLAAVEQSMTALQNELLEILRELEERS